MALTEDGWDLVLGEWARRLGVTLDVLRSSGTTFVPRGGADVIVVVRLGEACVVVAPESALARLRGVAREVLLDLRAVTAQVSALQPRPIGVATLGYRDVSTVSPGGEVVELADGATVDELQAQCSEEGWDESGLESMSPRWVSRTAAGHPAALAGHEPWGAHVAQLGVIAAPVHRRQGHALVAASAAVDHAVDVSGLIAQWRCRVGNTASERLSGRLGFVTLGAQLAVALQHGGD